MLCDEALVSSLWMLAREEVRLMSRGGGFSALEEDDEGVSGAKGVRGGVSPFACRGLQPEGVMCCTILLMTLMHVSNRAM